MLIAAGGLNLGGASASNGRIDSHQLVNSILADFPERIARSDTQARPQEVVEPDKTNKGQCNMGGDQRYEGAAFVTYCAFFFLGNPACIRGDPKLRSARAVAWGSGTSVRHCCDGVCFCIDLRTVEPIAGL